MKQRPILFALLAALAIPLAASAEPAAEATAEVDIKAHVLLAIKLPTLAYEARVAGVAETDVTETISAAKTAEVNAAQVAETFQATLEAIDEKGPVENFGKFVKTKLDEGLRGKDLAAAIKAEHEARGIGKGKKLGHHEDLLDATGKKYKKGKKPHRGEGHAEGHHKGHHEGKADAPGQEKEHDDKGLHLGHAGDADAKAALKAEKKDDKAADKAEKKDDKAEKKGDKAEHKPDKAEKKDDKAERKPDKAADKGGKGDGKKGNR